MRMHADRLCRRRSRRKKQSQQTQSDPGQSHDPWPEVGRRWGLLIIQLLALCQAVSNPPPLLFAGPWVRGDWIRFRTHALFSPPALPHPHPVLPALLSTPLLHCPFRMGGCSWRGEGPWVAGTFVDTTLKRKMGYEEYLLGSPSCSNPSVWKQIFFNCPDGTQHKLLTEEPEEPTLNFIYPFFFFFNLGWRGEKNKQLWNWKCEMGVGLVLLPS